MNLLVVGISHKKAPLELRERFALNERIIPEVLRRLQSEPEIEEAVILSTCNRVEFVLVAFEKQDAMAGFRRFAESFYGVRFDEFTHCFYVHHEGGSRAPLVPSGRGFGFIDCRRAPGSGPGQASVLSGEGSGDLRQPD